MKTATLRNLLLVIAGLAITQVAQADAGMSVYAVVAATLATATLGELKGNGLTNSMTSPVSKRQASLSAGEDANISIVRLNYRWQFSQPLLTGQSYVVLSNLEASIGRWQAKRASSPYQNSNDIGITPLFTLKRSTTDPWYAEVGVGAHLLSDIKIADYSKSTQFQFGDQFGIGWESNQFRIGYRYLHVSNANIEIPNPSTDFHMLEVAYRY